MQAVLKPPAARARHPRRRNGPTFVARRAGAPWTETITLSNRRRLVLRPIRPADVEALRRGFAALSPEDVRLRFLHPMTELTEELALRLCSPDPRKELALVLARPLRGYGLGEYLLRKLVAWARRKRLARIVGYVLSENDSMLALADKLGFTRASVPGEHGVIEVQLRLARP